MKKIDNILEKNIVSILLLYLFLQPVIDVITYFTSVKINLGISIGAIIKFLFILLLVYYIIFISKNRNRKKIFAYELVVLIYLMLYSMNILFLKTFDAFAYEMQNTIRTWFLPICFPIILSIYEDKKESVDKKDFIYIFGIYLLFIIIPYITGTSYTSYTQGKSGFGGWFISTNEISSLLSILFPLVFYNLSKLKKYWLSALIIVGTLFVFLKIGTKLPIISFGLTIFIFLILKFIKLFKEKNYKLVGVLSGCFIVFMISVIVLLPNTDFYKNLKTHADYLKIDSVTDIVTDKHLINRFVFSDRLSYLKKTYNNYKDSDTIEKLVGIGYLEKYNTIDENNKMIEMDPFDIGFRHGILGFFIYFIPLLGYFFNTIIKNLKKISPDYLLAIFMVIFTAVLSGHVLIAPGVSIFVIILFTNCRKETAK